VRIAAIRDVGQPLSAGGGTSCAIGRQCQRGNEAVEVRGAPRDQRLGLTAQRGEVGRAGVVQRVGRLVQAGLQAYIAGAAELACAASTIVISLPARSTSASRASRS
jgi:hypothetical protein